MADLANQCDCSMKVSAGGDSSSQGAHILRLAQRLHRPATQENERLLSKARVDCIISGATWETYEVGKGGEEDTSSGSVCNNRRMGNDFVSPRTNNKPIWHGPILSANTPHESRPEMCDFFRNMLYCYKGAPVTAFLVVPSSQA